MFPFHTWLPDAHTEAPTVGSVILAAVMLKLGTYGFVRFAFPLFPMAAAVFAPWIAVLSGTTTSAVPCQMHRSGETAAHWHAGHMRAGGDAGDDHHSQHQGTSARGCTCFGECGRSGASLAFQACDHSAPITRVASEPTMATERRASNAAVNLLPPATGPPQRLLS